VSVGEAALALGAQVRGYRSSGLAGPKGNRETFVWLSDPAQAGEGRRGAVGAAPPPGRESARARLERLAREVEP
jgi:hypothetical protein